SRRGCGPRRPLSKGRAWECAACAGSSSSLHEANVACSIRTESRGGRDTRRFRNSEARFCMTLSRSTFLKLGAATALAGGPASAQTGPRMHTRKIPSTGELLPVVGCGTWRTFDVGAAPAERAPLAEVLNVLFGAGGSVIDSSPMYGKAEGVVGDLLATVG